MTKSQTPTIAFLTEEEYDAQMAEMDETFHALAESNKNMAIPVKGTPLTRKRVVQGFMDCFEMIGGVPRLALWANENPGEYYKLYSKLLPSQAADDLDTAKEMTIRHVIPRSKLDE